MRWESPLTAVKAVVARQPALRSAPSLGRRMTAARLAALRRSGARTAPSS
jgi:hypothetical protein